MRIDEFKFETIVMADRGKYLKFLDEDLTEDKVGKPIRIIYSKTGILPDFTEESLIGEHQDVPANDVDVVEEEVPKKKTTRKKSSK